MTICGAANFHLAKPTAGSFEDPGLRRAASMIAGDAGIARDRIGRNLPLRHGEHPRPEDRKRRRDRTRPGKQDLAGLDALLLRQTRTCAMPKRGYSPLSVPAPHMTELLHGPVAPHITLLPQTAEKPDELFAPHITELPHNPVAPHITEEPPVVVAPHITELPPVNCEGPHTAGPDHAIDEPHTEDLSLLR
jgi:hypothetical protein